jgi:hypothetical protein
VSPWLHWISIGALGVGSAFQESSLSWTMTVMSSCFTMLILCWRLPPGSLLDVFGHDLGRSFVVSGEFGTALLGEPHLLDQRCPARLAVSSSWPCTPVTLDVLALAAVRVVVLVLLEVGDVYP